MGMAQNLTLVWDPTWCEWKAIVDTWGVDLGLKKFLTYLFDEGDHKILKGDFLLSFFLVRITQNKFLSVLIFWRSNEAVTV